MRWFPILLVFVFAVLARSDPFDTTAQYGPREDSMTNLDRSTLPIQASITRRSLRAKDGIDSAEGGTSDEMKIAKTGDTEERGMASTILTKLSQTKANVKYNLKLHKSDEAKMNYILKSSMSDIDKAKYLSKLDMTDDNLAKLLGMENMSVAAMKRHPNYNLYYAVTYNVNTRMINKLFKTKTEPSTLWKQLGLPTGETTSVAELKNIKRNDPNFDTYIRYVTKYDKELDAFKTKEQKLLEKYKMSKQFDEDAQPSPELVRMFNVNWDGPDIVYPAEILARADMWAKAGKSDDYVLTMLGMPSLKESSKFAHSYNYKAFLQFKEAAGTLSKNS